MNAEPTAPSRAEIVDELSKWTVGLGILTVALAPLSIPILALTAVALLPLLVPVIGLALVAAIIAAPVFLVRGGVRSLRGRRRNAGRGGHRIRGGTSSRCGPSRASGSPHPDSGALKG